MKINLAIQLYKNMGSRYVAYRVFHELEKKLGRLRKKHPTDLVLLKPISLSEWHKSKNPFVISEKEQFTFDKKPSEILKKKAERIKSGELHYFNEQWLFIGKDYDWITNPSNGYSYDVAKHWSEIPDLSEEAGDIKYVWEKSRFSYFLTLIRYDYHFDEDLSEFIFSEIESWIDANPINQGPNWLCSQEISLRMFNWCYALYFYQNSEALTEKRWQKIQNVIYASVHHVYHHINFSRIAVRNNHAITETLFLTLSNILFPFIPETKKWSEEGLKWFEEEIAYQIYQDGTFLQFSMNYHRVVVQLLSFGISIFEKNSQQFSDLVYQKAYKSLNFLYQCMQNENGWLPNYGSNDGALFFIFSDTDYRDYRPQLNTLHKVLTGKLLFQIDIINEDYNWVQGAQNKIHFSPLRKIYGVQSFDVGGYYLCRNGDFFTFIRCGNHKDRPAQADNLHVDIWHKGENILRDSGTYKYNTEPDNLNFFMGSKSHNVVMVGEHSQMLKGGRFIWYYWSQKREAKWRVTDEAFVFTGSINAFRHLEHKAIHQRVVKISKHDYVWLVTDSFKGLDSYEKKQIWHPNSLELEISSEGNHYNEFDSFNSDYYGQLQQKKSVYFEFKYSIETKLKFICK
ncbi:heparinase II/III-family protein [Flavobacterium sp.]|jgi:hypothetical protein|uniref:heparinase II/III family protein n=1 Tax=Flavobacterium sp. TaxID=239 RepID=UPI0033424145